MFTVLMMAAAIALGYAATVAIAMISTFAVTMALPKFVEEDFLIRNGYKLVHEGFWLVCAVTGGFVAAVVVKGVHPMVTEALLAGALIWVLWENSWEARQRGTAHQVLITTLTVLGVAAGYMLHRQIV